MKPKPPKRRVLTAREKLMRRKYVRLVKWPDGCALFLSIGVQSFQIGPLLRTQFNAQWTADMLAVALSRIYESDDCH